MVKSNLFHSKLDILSLFFAFQTLYNQMKVNTQSLWEFSIKGVAIIKIFPDSPYNLESALKLSMASTTFLLDRRLEDCEKFGMISNKLFFKVKEVLLFKFPIR